MKRILIKVGSREIFFRRYVEIMNGIWKLRDRELDVLMMLIYYYDLHWCDRIDQVVFSPEIKGDICKRLGISVNVMNNCISYLRRMGIIIGRSVLRKYLIRFNSVVNINFTLNAG